MVRITFDVDDDVMRADADNEVSEARRGLLVETYFEFPVHFVVGDTDLLRASAARLGCAVAYITVLRPAWNAEIEPQVQGTMETPSCSRPLTPPACMACQVAFRGSRPGPRTS